jgi:DNA repair ATPase RecN
MKIKIENFQSLKDIELDVSGLTILTGSNNTGKSAVIRAVSGVFNNTRGNSFVRYGEKHSTVSVEWSDTEKVTWEKGKSTNRYTINGKVFDKVGSNAPDELKDLGVYTLKAGGKEVSPQLAPQFTGQVFLLDQPGSVIADCIADSERVVGLNKALKESDKQKRGFSSILKVREGDLQKLDTKLEAYEGLDEEIKECGRLSKDEAKLAKANRMMVWVTEKRDALREEYETLSILSPATQIAIPNLSELRREAETLVWAQDTLTKIKEARFWAEVSVEEIGIPNVSALQKRIDLLGWLQDTKRQWDEATKKASLTDEITIPSERKLKKAWELYKTLYDLRASYSDVLKKLRQDESRLEDIDAELNELREEIKSVSEVCHACGRPLEGSDHC